MITITITGTPLAGKALQYERPGRQGKRAYVPIYRAFVECAITGNRFEFATTRTSSLQTFGEPLESRYAEKGECPPSAEVPYKGLVREDGAVGFRIELVEPGHEEAKMLKGQGTALRKHIQIHFGPAASFGCLSVAGRRRHYRSRFERPLRAMLAHSREIRVIVEPRTAHAT